MDLTRQWWALISKRSWVGILGCWEYMRDIYESLAALAKQSQGCVWCSREAPHPGSPSRKQHSAHGNCSAQSMAPCLSRWCRWWQAAWHSTAQHGTSPHFAPPSTPLSDAETWSLCWPWGCVSNREAPGRLPALGVGREWEIRVIGKNKQL